jgi:hypothetical protein
MQPEYGIPRDFFFRISFLPQPLPDGDGDRETSMIQPVRLLAAVTVCAALLIPARIAFSAPTATAVTTQVQPGR